MKVYRDLEELKGIKNPVVTTGSFDGVHVGHKVIISRLKKLARDINGETVLITFYPHPRRVLYPDAEGKDLLMINTQREKIWLLEKTGIDHLIIVNFTREFSMISSHDFIEKVLADLLKVKVVVVGFNHHFGHRREGDFESLYNLGKIYGFEVEEIPEQDIQNESVSSTRIRAALLQGNIQRANAYLDHFYIIKTILQPSPDLPAFSALRFYKLHPEENVKLCPPDGVYAVNVEGKGFFEKGMLVISGWGIQDSYMSPNLMTILHLPHYEKDIAGEDVTLYFHKCVRSGVNGNGIQLSDNYFRNDLKEIEELIY